MKPVYFDFRFQQPGECTTRSHASIGSVLIITRFLVVRIRLLRRRRTAIARENEIVSATGNVITTRSTRRSIKGRRGRSLSNESHQRKPGERKNHLLLKEVEATNGRTRGCGASPRALYAATRRLADNPGDSLILLDLRIRQRGTIHTRVYLIMLESYKRALYM